MPDFDGYQHRHVALFGEFCAGKTTLAEELSDEYGFVRVNMAANLKSIIQDVYGTLDKGEYVDIFSPVTGEEEARTVRQILQEFGQNAKLHDQHFWLRWFLKDTSFYEDHHLVMDDGRLPFEAAELRKRGWLIVKLDVPLDVRLRRFEGLYGKLPAAGEMHHATETQMDGIDYDLRLDGQEPEDVLAERVMRAYCQ